VQLNRVVANTAALVIRPILPTDESGLAQYVADEAGDGCEVAIVVGDAWQRQGLGTDLLSALMDVAAYNGVTHVHADVLADNHAMRALARKLGCEARTNMQAPILAKISGRLESRDEP
jgi:acetyltransferase